METKNKVYVGMDVHDDTVIIAVWPEQTGSRLR